MFLYNNIKLATLLKGSYFLEELFIQFWIKKFIKYLKSKTNF